MKIEYTYEERVTWFFENYYETGMEYESLLISFKDVDFNNFEWYGEKITFPKYKNNEYNKWILHTTDVYRVGDQIVKRTLPMAIPPTNGDRIDIIYRELNGVERYLYNTSKKEFKKLKKEKKINGNIQLIIDIKGGDIKLSC